MSLLFTRSPFPAAEESGADVTNFSDWTVGTRPGASMSEGDFAVDTVNGRGYRWDATVGALLPIDVYGNTFDLVARVNGDEVDASELTNYEEDKSAGANGDITYSGTSVTLEGTSPNGQVVIRIPQTLEDANVDNTKNFYYRFVAQQANVVGTNHVLALMIYDGTQQFHFRRVSTNPFRRTNSAATGEIPVSITDDAPFGPTDTNTHVVEMYVKRDSDEDVAYAIVDGKVYHCSALDQGSNSSTTAKAIQFFCRGNASGNSLDFVVYESTFCAY